MYAVCEVIGGGPGKVLMLLLGKSELEYSRGETARWLT